MARRTQRSRLLRYLVILALLTGVFTSGTLARYASEEAGGASALVASFAAGGSVTYDVTLEDDLYPGSGVKTIDFTVANYENDRDSDVALDYDIELKTTGNLPLQFSMLGEKESTDSSAASVLVGVLEKKDDYAWTAQGGKLPVVKADRRCVHRYRVSVYWPGSDSNVDVKDENYSDEIDMLTITVTARQAGRADS